MLETWFTLSLQKSENKTSQASQKPTKNIEIIWTCFDIEIRVKERVV